MKGLWQTPKASDYKVDVNDNGEYARRCKAAGFQVALPQQIKMEEMETPTKQKPAQLSIFSPAGSPVSHFLVPGSREARKMTVTSGRRCYALYQKYARLGSLVKMLLESSTWHSTKCYLTWKTRATPANRLLFQLAPKTPRTDGIGFGLLPTASAWDGQRGPSREYNPKSDSQKDRNLNTFARIFPRANMWPTPTATERENDITAQPSEKTKERFAKGEIARIRKTRAATLQTAVKMLPTPSSSMMTEADMVQAQFAGNSPDRPKYEDAGNGSLNPQFVEWLMGYEIGWTDLNL